MAFGVDAAALEKANGYVIDEVGKPPDAVIEMAPPTTGLRDYTVKRRIYGDMAEHWRFDDTGGQYHDEPLAGDILADGEYRREPIRVDPDGTLWGYSPAFALFLVWDDGRLRFYAPRLPARHVGSQAPNRLRTRRQNHVRAPRRRSGSGAGAAEAPARGFGAAPAGLGALADKI